MNVGQELEISITAEDILLKTKPVLPETTVYDLIGCTGYQGQAKSLEDMSEAIRLGIITEWGKHDLINSSLKKLLQLMQNLY